MRHPIRLLPALVLLLAAPVSLQAQGSAEPRSSTGVIVHPGDLIRVRLWPDQPLSGDYPVESNGVVVIPLVGEVGVGGKSLAEARTQLRDRYSALVQNGIVSVSLVFKVSVVGAVVRPNLYVAEPTSTVLDIISQAGGLTPDADAKHVRLLRGDRVVELDAGREMSTGEPVLGVFLQSGDRVVVPPMPKQRFSWQTVMTVLQTVTLALVLFKNH
ncbi:MAG: polysaccharide export protein [Gemmatimonadetes bacterium]|nr:polysaccharide export protein [Gemmatimonadota bacterium]